MNPTAAPMLAELLAARDAGIPVQPFSTRDGGLDLPTAYAVEAGIRRAREEQGHKAVGRKAGYANRALWRALKLETLVWAHMYDDTVQFAPAGECSATALSGARIEPEIVFRFRDAPAAGCDAAGILEAVEWLAVGLEIIVCPYPEWKFQPADFVAAWGLHRGLTVGPPRKVVPSHIPQIVEELQNFKLKLYCNEEAVEEGAGRNSLRSPALCAAEFATAAMGNAGSEAVRAGELFSSGTLTAARPVASGETWRVELDGLSLENLAVRFV